MKTAAPAQCGRPRSRKWCATLIVELQERQIVFPEASALITRMAATDPGFQELLIDMLSTSKTLDAEQVATLRGVAINDKAAARFGPRPSAC